MPTVLRLPFIRGLARFLQMTVSMAVLVTALMVLLVNVLLVMLLDCGAERNTRTSFASMKEWNQVQMGMSEQEVVRLLGQPEARDVRRFPKDDGIATISLLYGAPINPRENHMLYVVLMGGDGRVIETRAELQD